MTGATKLQGAYDGKPANAYPKLYPHPAGQIWVRANSSGFSRNWILDAKRCNLYQSSCDSSMKALSCFLDLQKTMIS